MNFGIIIIGDEILSGKRSDKHLSKAIELLSARGLQLAYADYVGDEPARITATLKRAFASGDAVFSFGGIGATPDDHTRQCAGLALERDMALSPQAEALIRERMQDVAREQGVAYEPDRSDNVHRLNMGVFPKGAQIIPNPFNKIPGFFCSAGSDPHAVGERGGIDMIAAGPPQGARAPSGGSDPHAVGERGGIFFLPGFPVMAHPMMAWVLDTYFSDLFVRDAWVEQSVIVFGAMEATLTPLMQAIERDHAVKVFSLPSVDHPQFGRHIELGVKGTPQTVAPAYAALLAGLKDFSVKLGPEMVRS
ncbi:MAG: competence/damage-inducible protein A [Rhodoferax sp.]|nr:competence/damage-inducible protein A [Rhodoferax sp.]